MKKIIILLCIIFQTVTCFAAGSKVEHQKNKISLEEIMESLDSWLKGIAESVYIIIDEDKSIYFHDITTLGTATFDENQKVTLDEIDSRVKEFVEKGEEYKLRSVGLIVSKNIQFDYLYKVIKHYEDGLTKHTGINEVSYRLGPL